MSGIIGTQIILGLVFLLPAGTPENPNLTRSFLILAAMLAFLFFMQSFMAVVYWLMMAELFPLRVRGLAMGIAVFCQWISNMLVTFLFPVLLKAVEGHVFFIFAAINVICFVFEWKYLPETRGKSLEELERELASGKDGKAPAEQL